MGRALSTGPQHGACEHCGLASGGDAFCCYGCELAHRLLADDGAERQRAAASLTLSLLLGMIVMMLSLFLYAEDIYDAARAPMLVWLRTAYAWASAALATPVVLLLGVPLARRAWRRGGLTMELLIVSAAGSAYVVSLASLLRGGTEIYFESAVAGLLMATFGRYIEALARSRASALVGRLLEQDDVRGAADIEVGMPVTVPPDATVPVDLEARSAAEVSLAVLTGESAPVGVAPGDEVAAGAVVLSGNLEGVALRAAKDSTLERLARLTASLRSERSAVLRLADRLARWLTPVVALVAGFALWHAGLEAALAVVLVACPCTYGVITPLISWLALRKALEHGVCIRHAGVLDALARARTVAFDKTGTLTEPLSAVTMTTFGEDPETVASWVAALEQDVPHPIARCLLAHAERTAAAAQIEDRRIEPRRVTARLPDGRDIAIGAAPGDTTELTALTVDGEVVATFAVDERVRDEAAAVIVALREQGLKTVVLSGDREARVRHVAAALQLDEAFGGLTPEQKVERLAQLERPALVGDGINDAPAAAAALASFAVDRSATLQRGLADVALLEPDLSLVPWSLGLASRAASLARRTLFAATAYNVVFVSLAAFGMLRPLWAGLSMIAASLIALAGALRITRYVPPHRELPSAPSLRAEAVA